jgi:hypothetical protein
MADTPHDGSGTTVTFSGGFSGDVTGISYSESAGGNNDIDISHLGQTVGETALSMSRPLKGGGGETGKEVQIDYIGSSVVEGGKSGTLSITGGLTISGVATCTSSSVTLAVNDVIKGSATFRVA